LLGEYVSDAIFERSFYLDNGKIVSRIWVELTDVSLNNPNSWNKIFDFFSEKMTQFELFFIEYEDYIKDLNLNI
jgi:hypothetical protein